ncbi:hypothetical protein Ciccas_010430, partial [Cichlidogyrus casuarinus]
RGQFLDAFLAQFYQSCEDAPTTPVQAHDAKETNAPYNRFDNVAGETQVKKPSMLENRCRLRALWNNAGLTEASLIHRDYKLCDLNVNSPDGLYDLTAICLDQLTRTHTDSTNYAQIPSQESDIQNFPELQSGLSLQKFFSLIRAKMLGLLDFLRPLVQSFVDRFLVLWLSRKLTSTCTPSIVANLIGQLHEIAFSPTQPKLVAPFENRLRWDSVSTRQSKYLDRGRSAC